MHFRLKEPTSSGSKSAAHHVAQQAGGSHSMWVDNRPSAILQRKLHSAVNQNLTAGIQLQGGVLSSGLVNTSRLVVQRVLKRAPSGIEIEVTPDEDYLPICVDNGEVSRKMYRRTGGISRGWNDTDLFYADGEGGLVQITIKMVNDYWDPKYPGFTKLSGPDWTQNCEEYAVAEGEGTSSGTYSNTDKLKELITDTRKYVIKMGFHWMRVEKTGADAVTIRQKDAESAVYSKNFTLDGACTYILEKYSGEGTVYRL